VRDGGAVFALFSSGKGEGAPATWGEVSKSLWSGAVLVQWTDRVERGVVDGREELGSRGGESRKQTTKTVRGELRALCRSQDSMSTLVFTHS
jgi:hypothetical protein